MNTYNKLYRSIIQVFIIKVAFYKTIISITCSFHAWNILQNINHFNITHTLVSIFMFIRVCDRINPQIDIIGLFFQHVLVFNFTAYIYVGKINIEFSTGFRFIWSFNII